MALWSLKQSERDLICGRLAPQDQVRSSKAADASPALPTGFQTGAGDAAVNEVATMYTQVDTASSPAADRAASLGSRELRGERLDALTSGSSEHRVSRDRTDDFDAAGGEEADIDHGLGAAEFEVAGTSGPLPNTVDVVLPVEYLVKEAVRVQDGTGTPAGIENDSELSHMVPPVVRDSRDRDVVRDGRLSGDLAAYEACRQVESIMSDALHNIAEMCDRVVAAESSVSDRISALLEEIGELEQQREKLKVIQNAVLPLLVPAA